MCVGPSIPMKRKEKEKNLRINIPDFPWPRVYIDVVGPI